MRRYDVIHKYKLTVNENMDPQVIDMPAGDILTVMEQDKQIVLYAIHSVYSDDYEPVKMPHRFVVLGTGWEYEIPHDRTSIKGHYVGTVKVDGLMWHVFRLWD